MATVDFKVTARCVMTETVSSASYGSVVTFARRSLGLLRCASSWRWCDWQAVAGACVAFDLHLFFMSGFSGLILLISHLCVGSEDASGFGDADCRHLAGCWSLVRVVWCRCWWCSCSLPRLALLCGSSWSFADDDPCWAVECQGNLSVNV